MNWVKDIEGISVVSMNENDIVRHKLVTRIVNAFKKADNAYHQAKERQTDKPAPTDTGQE